VRVAASLMRKVMPTLTIRTSDIEFLKIVPMEMWLDVAANCATSYDETSSKDSYLHA
jgi:hypothetical protein